MTRSNAIVKGGSMSGLQVTPEDVSSAAGNCSTTAESIRGALADLKGYAIDVQNMWHGVASDTFADLMTDYDTFGRMMNDSLVDIGEGLHGNYVNYEATETANIDSLIKVNGVIPGAFPGAVPPPNL
jgi:WXG100 family type VII secretion target